MSSLVMYGLVRAKVTIFSRCPLTLRVRPARARVGSTLFQCNDGVGVSVGCDCDDAGADDDTIGGASVGAASGMASTAAGGSVACGTSASTVTACTTGSEIGSGTTSAGATAGSGAGSGGDSGAGATSSLMRKTLKAHFEANRLILCRMSRFLLVAAQAAAEFVSMRKGENLLEEQRDFLGYEKEILDDIVG